MSTKTINSSHPSVHHLSRQPLPNLTPSLLFPSNGKIAGILGDPPLTPMRPSCSTRQSATDTSRDGWMDTSCLTLPVLPYLPYLSGTFPNTLIQGSSATAPYEAGKSGSHQKWERGPPVHSVSHHWSASRLDLYAMAPQRLRYIFPRQGALSNPRRDGYQLFQKSMCHG